ncbi:hypothetical protein L0222_02780 [bacterium]|nr:hypothetical protein [bacterium]MCI0604788.1 hypothetical protein [bacterium]
MFLTAKAPRTPRKIKKILFFLLAFLASWRLTLASDFQLEKQKLKFSLEYESFIDSFRNEVITPGLKANYLLKGKSKVGKSAILHFDYQTGLKTNLQTSFESGELAKLLWSNRLNTSFTIPFGKCYAGTNFFLRHKWVSESSNQFVDIFGGLGFRDVQTGVYFGIFPYPNWEVVVSALASDVNFNHFEDSNSTSKGGSVRISRRLQRLKINLDYRIKKINYNRPVFFVSSDAAEGELKQQDDFEEAGLVVELLHPIYVSGGYSYQTNDSNNPGFSYKNHRFSLLVGTGLGEDFHLQAYGIAQRQDFEQSVQLLSPVLLEDSDYDTMGISLVKTISELTELEVGAQRLNHNSSFRELDASKFILFAALNLRF